MLSLCLHVPHEQVLSDDCLLQSNLAVDLIAEIRRFYTWQEDVEHTFATPHSTGHILGNQEVAFLVQSNNV